MIKDNNLVMTLKKCVSKSVDCLLKTISVSAVFIGSAYATTDNEFNREVTIYDSFTYVVSRTVDVMASGKTKYFTESKQASGTIVEFDKFNVANDINIRLAKYINLDGLVCVQYVKSATPVFEIIDNKVSRKVVGTNFTVAEYCDTKVMVDDNVYPEGLASLAVVSNDDNSVVIPGHVVNWHTPVFK